jgi:hypothetical protein
MAELTYEFDSPDEALAYLREVSKLWVVWIVGLAGLMVTNAVLLIVWAVVVLVSLALAVRPLQRRAEELVPENTVEGGKVNTVLRGGTTRDRALRDYLYGTKPLESALEAAGVSRHWVMIRHVVVLLTLLSLVYVVFGPRP